MKFRDQCLENDIPYPIPNTDSGESDNVRRTRARREMRRREVKAIWLKYFGSKKPPILPLETSNTTDAEPSFHSAMESYNDGDERVSLLPLMDSVPQERQLQQTEALRCRSSLSSFYAVHKSKTIMIAELDEEHTTCSICVTEFSCNRGSQDPNIRQHLPVLSSSQRCDHWFCHGCILREQQRVAEENNGKVPKWIRCMHCRGKTSFNPAEPKYHRLLIDLLARAQSKYAALSAEYLEISSMQLRSDATMIAELDEEHTKCSICLTEFSYDRDSQDSDSRQHLPVLSSSQRCDHWFCHGCILQEQQRVAEANNGKVPKWIRCMHCREKTSFNPAEPMYHRLLIDLLARAQKIRQLN